MSEWPVARFWHEQYGVTAEDIEIAQARLRADGFPEHLVRDPGYVQQRLPMRDIQPVTIDQLEIPGRVPSGQPIRFVARGRFPDSSFSFTRFVITREGDRIQIDPRGEKSGDVAPQIEVATVLEGVIEPLEAGVYLVSFSGNHTVAPVSLIVD